MIRTKTTIMLVETDLFEHVQVLRGLPVEQQDFLRRYAQYKNYTKQMMIYEPGEPAEWVYFVIKGVVRVGSVSEDGRELVKNVIYAGEMFGELGVAGIGARPDYAATFKAGAEVMRLPLDAMRELMVRNPEIGQRLIQKLGARVANSEKRMEQLVFNDARTRIIEFFHELMRRSGAATGGEIIVTHGFTHQDMANITGTSRQLVTIILNELKKKKILTFDRTTIRVKKASELA